MSAQSSQDGLVVFVSDMRPKLQTGGRGSSQRKKNRADLPDRLRLILVCDPVEAAAEHGVASWTFLGGDQEAVVHGDLHRFQLGVQLDVQMHLATLWVDRFLSTAFCSASVSSVTTPLLTKEEKAAELKKWFAGSQLDAEVLHETLGERINHITPLMLLKASAKLIRVNKLEQEPDNRDNLKFSTFLGIEDFVKEHIEKDAGRLRFKAKMKLQQKRNLAWLHAGFFTPQIRSVVIGNTLSTNVDGVNPMEHYDNSHRVTKLGEGGISSVEAVPDESRQVSESSFGFIDPLHISESDRVGVTGYFAHNVVKGRDNKLYRLMFNPKVGKNEWVHHEKVLASKVLIPEH